MDSDQRRHKIGIVYILAAWAFFTLMTIVARIASQRISLATILFFQNLIGLVTVLPWINKHGWSLLRTQRLGLLSFRSVVSLVAVAFSFLAVQRISLVDTMLLTTTSPLWITFVIWIWRKIPINHILWPGLIAGFLGIVLILRPGKEILQLGAFFGLGAGILQSLNMVSLRVLSYTERNHSVMFYYFLICTVICFPVSIYQWVNPSLEEWIEIFTVGLLFSLGQWTFVRAFHHAKASQLGPFCYAAVVYSVLVDWGLYRQIPDLFAWIGIGLVCAGGIWAIRLASPDSQPQK